MEYGIWETDYGSLHTMSICKRHGLQEFRINIYKQHGTNYIKKSKHCLLCNTNSRNNIHTSNVAGCKQFTGLYIAEGVLSKVFNTMIKAPPNYRYDFICGKGLKIDSKCSLMRINRGNGWNFNISKNTFPDIFCLIALENTIKNVEYNPSPKYVWLIPGDAIIDGRSLNNRQGFSVSPTTISKLEQYRRTDMEGRIIKCCDKLK